MKIIKLNSIEELIEQLSNENDRIGDFEPIKWHITKENFVIETCSGKFLELIKKPSETTKGDLVLTKEEIESIVTGLDDETTDQELMFKTKDKIELWIKKDYGIVRTVNITK